MSVLQRKELEDSPLADLHAIAAELGIEGYRALRREDVVAAILDVQGGDDGEEQASDEDEEQASDEDAEREPREKRSRGRSTRGGRGRRSRASGGRRDASDDDDAGAKQDARSAVADATSRTGSGGTASEDAGDDEDADDDRDGDGEPVAGVLDILPNGSGFLRIGEPAQSTDDAYISPAQIRRCELRAGDDVAGPSRPARRNERHPSLVRIETVNGSPAEPPEQRPRFEDLTAVHPRDRLAAPEALGSVPFGLGSRVAVAGGPGAGATWLLREVVAALRERHAELPISVVLAGARPEEVGDWRREAGVSVTGGSFDQAPEAQARSAELASERAKRIVERGGDAVVVIDSLDALPQDVARRVFGAARKVEEAGSLTVIAATGTAPEPQRQAGTWIMLEAPGEGGEARVSHSRSSTQRADLLG